MRPKLIFLLYRVLQAAAFPLLLLYVLWRGLRDRRYAGSVLERYGFLPRLFKRTIPDSIWLHAVSVGEVLSCITLIQKLKNEMPDAPGLCLVLDGRREGCGPGKALRNG